MKPTITIITPWFEHLELAADYWDAIGEQDAHKTRLIIVDDGSTPSLSFAAIRFEEREGFSRACNAGLAAARTDAVLFLNNDIAGGNPNWLESIRSFLEPGVLVGAVMRHDAHGEVDGVKLPYLDGWCLAGMREELLDLGGFDEGLEEPAYYSDNLLCLEARAAGMSLRAVATGLEHKCGATSQPHRNPEVQRASMTNRERFVARARELLVPT